MCGRVTRAPGTATLGRWLCISSILVTVVSLRETPISPLANGLATRSIVTSAPPHPCGCAARHDLSPGRYGFPGHSATPGRCWWETAPASGVRTLSLSSLCAAKQMARCLSRCRVAGRDGSVDAPVDLSTTGGLCILFLWCVCGWVNSCERAGAIGAPPR